MRGRRVTLRMQSILREYGARETGHAKDAVYVEGVWCEGDGSR